MSELTFRPLTTWPGRATPAGDRQRSRFDTPWSKTLRQLDHELMQLEARNIVMEADCDASEIRLDGHFRANAKLRGPGVVLSFECHKGELRFPCDTYTDWQANVRAITLALEALRAVDRYGVTQHAEQYKGWAKLEGPATAIPSGVFTRQSAAEWIRNKCHECSFLAPSVKLLQVDQDSLRAAYRSLVSVLHPDRRGSDVEFKQLMSAMEVLQQ